MKENPTWPRPYSLSPTMVAGSSSPDLGQWRGRWCRAEHLQHLCDEHTTSVFKSTNITPGDTITLQGTHSLTVTWDDQVLGVTTQNYYEEGDLMQPGPSPAGETAVGTWKDGTNGTKLTILGPDSHSSYQATMDTSAGQAPFTVNIYNGLADRRLQSHEIVQRKAERAVGRSR